MERRKIVHVIESAAGGSLRYVQNICDHLDPKEWDVTVLYSKREDTPPDLRQQFPDSVQLIETNMIREISAVTDFQSARELRALFSRLQPDLIHLHSSKAGAVGRLAAWGMGAAVVYTPHGFSFFRRDVPALKRWFYRAVERMIAAATPSTFLVGSLEEKRQAVQLASESRVHLLFNAVEVPLNPTGMEGSVKRFATLGRITPQKDPFYVLDIAESVQRRCPDAEFVWIGDGELRAEFEKQAEQRGVRVTVTGWVSQEEARDWLASSRAYVHASLWEGLPLALLEAMGMARPVAVSDIVVHTDVVTAGSEGAVCQTAEEFADAVSIWLNDPQEAGRIGNKAWQTARRLYSQELFVNGILDFYRQTTGRG